MVTYATMIYRAQIGSERFFSKIGGIRLQQKPKVANASILGFYPQSIIG